jgi:peptide/nickel transport system substrate-binding protein
VTRLFRLLALVLAPCLLAAACGGGDDGDGGGAGEAGPNTTAAEEEEGAGEPVAGGELTVAFDAETNGGYCLPEAQLAGAGTQVVRTIYDTLGALNEDNEVEPFLAESIEPNSDFTEWTITLRDGITFHDGSPLDAQIVADNLNAYRGAYDKRSPLLFTFVLQNIADVQVAGPLEVRVAMKSPWAAFDQQLALPRLSMVGRAQLDADDTTCANQLVGTGPFSLDHWTVNSELTVVKNPSYWMTDEAGRTLPYLDMITFRPIPDTTQRINAFEAGQVDVLQSPDAENLARRLRPGAEAGEFVVNEFAGGTTTHIILNASKPPFDNKDARLAVAHALDRDLLIEVVNAGITKKANGPFQEGFLGYTEDTGFPEFDLEKVKEHADAYQEATGEPLSFTYGHPANEQNSRYAQELETQWTQAGLDVNIVPSGDQAQHINKAISGDFEAFIWTAHPGEDPDNQYIWWYGGSPVNFGRITDPEIDRLLDEGRGTTEGRDEIYLELNERFGSEAYNVWLWHAIVATAHSNEVHGMLDTKLPSGNDFPLGRGGDLLTATWLSQE